MTAPVVAALKSDSPDITIDYLVHERFAPLVRHFDPPPDHVISFRPDVRAGHLPGYARDLAATGYDVVIDLHDSLRSKLLRRYFGGAELRIYRKPRLRRWLLFYLWINRFPADYSVTAEYLRFARLSVEGAALHPRMRVDPELARETRQRFGLGEGYVACIPGAAWPQKTWLRERYLEVFGRGGTGFEHPIVLLGGGGDTICDQIAADLPGDSGVNLRGKTSLEDALAVLSGSRLVIGADTGLLHAGEALGVPAVMILGPTSRETGARSHHPESRVHQVSLWCRPCSQNGRRKCYRREQYCLTRVPADRVAESVQQLLVRA
ncbi:MAG: glycosyltransferase family 9 protein [Candidatus Neomarinimicrobiota bacterium]